MKKPIALAWLVAALVLGAPSWAISLQEIVETTKSSVAHVGILDPDGQEISSGSGFVISEDGRLVTNFHVVDGASRVVAIFAGDKKVDVVGAWALDKSQDLAVLQLAPGTYPSLALSSSTPQQGDQVIVIGSPLGLAGSVSTGIVSAIRSTGAVPVSGHDDWHDKRVASWGIQISAPVSPGSSGSPALDAEGKVMGVAVGVMGGGFGGQALNFAVPVSKLREVLAAVPPGGRPKALSAVSGRRSVTTNLMISAAGLAAAALLWWLGTFVSERRGRPARHGPGSS